MKKTMISVSLDEATVDELEKFAKSMGLSRSAAVNMLLSGCLGTGDTATSIIRQMLSAAKPKGRAKKAGEELARA